MDRITHDIRRSNWLEILCILRLDSATFSEIQST